MFFRKKKPTIQASDFIWQNSALKLNGIVGQVARATGEGKVTLVVAHFEKTLAEVEAALQKAGQSFEAVRTLRWLDKSRAPTLLSLSEKLPAVDAPAGEKDSAPPVEVIVAERYPLAARDTAVAEVAASFGPGSTLSFHSSLEDVLLKEFCSPGIGALLTHLGLAEEPVESTLISNALQQAQRTMGKKVRHEQRARSAEEWLQYNIR